TNDATPLGFTRTPKPFNAPSPASHLNTSRPVQSGRKASTRRLVSLGIGALSKICFPEGHSDEGSTGEAAGKQLRKFAATTRTQEISQEMQVSQRLSASRNFG